MEGFAGYSLPDDLLSGMGLAIGYSVLAAFPIIGGWLAELVWGGEFPGGEEFISRLYAAHVFILPLAHLRADRPAPVPDRQAPPHPVRRARGGRSAT